MKPTMVRYPIKPDRAAENEALVRAVYDELQHTGSRSVRPSEGAAFAGNLVRSSP